ncbi:hypothetical protein [Pseudomonas sp. NPDC089569]|uniref:hypothetical protein n=1 Tax=Pseudomonas sp. NPDC089569 TaxID=3390722 RepID=UPI003D013991
MIYESEIIPKGSTVEWGFVFKECAESEGEQFVLMLGISADMNLDEIEASFKANEWAAKAICSASLTLVGESASPGTLHDNPALAAPGEDHMRIAKAVMDACQRAVDKSRSLSNINLENVVDSALRQG